MGKKSTKKKSSEKPKISNPPEESDQHLEPIPSLDKNLKKLISKEDQLKMREILF